MKRYQDSKMIINHKYKIIFIKTIKVAGTSFEIALSKFCDKDDIINPLIVRDENTRKSYCFQGPVNYKSAHRWKYFFGKHPNKNFKGLFYNHMTSKLIFDQVGKEIFNSYNKITIHHNPIDKMISLYFWATRHKKIKFKDWLSTDLNRCTENYDIAPMNGPLSANYNLRFENLYEDIKNCKILPNNFIETFKKIKAKSNIKPSITNNAKLFFEKENCMEYYHMIIELVKNHKNYKKL